MAGIPDDLEFREKWRIGVEQVKQAIGNGVRFSWLTFDEEFGSVPAFWFALDALGQRAVGEAKSNFRAWATKPACRSLRHEHASRRVDDLCRHSPAFTTQSWHTMKIKDTTRGPVNWRVKAACVYLVDHDDDNVPTPTDRQYWLIIAKHPGTGEVKHFISNAASYASRRRSAAKTDIS